MNKHLKAGLVALALGFFLGPTFVESFNHFSDGVITGETPLVKQPINWGCVLIGYKCYQE